MGFIVLYGIAAALMTELIPDTLITRKVPMERYIMPPWIFLPIRWPLVLFMWLGVDLSGDFSMEASLYRITIWFAPIILFYSAVAYLLLGRLKWFRENIDEGALPEPPPPPEFR